MPALCSRTKLNIVHKLYLIEQLQREESESQCHMSHGKILVILAFSCSCDHSNRYETRTYG